MTLPEVSSGPSREKVGEMFDRISHRYDLLNRLLSLRRDVAWRKLLCRYLPSGAELEILDLACGTADVMLTLKERSQRVKTVVGLDLSRGMLSIGKGKIDHKGHSTNLAVVEGNAKDLPFPDRSFDAATIAFGIRNLAQLETSLAEIRRVLRPKGRFIVLEFSLPANKLIRSLYLVYFRHILPWLGGMISGDRSAYRYLDSTVETFPYGEEMVRILRAAGFADVTRKPLTFGIATIYVADNTREAA